MRLVLVATAILAMGCGRKESVPVSESATTAPVTLEAAAKELGIELAQLEETEVYRSSKKRASLQALFPRGDLRWKDLDTYRVDITSAFKGGGTLEFRIGEKTLHSEPFDPEDFETTATIPPAVRTGLKEGKTVTWGFYPTKGKKITATFKVIKESSKLQRRIEKLEKKFDGAADYILTALRAQLFLDSRLYYAAYREARRATRMGGEDPQPYAIMQAALRRLKLHKTALYAEVEEYAVKGRFSGGRFSR